MNITMSQQIGGALSRVAGDFLPAGLLLGEPVDVIYLDLQKAFDKVPHMRLLTKLRGYGIQGQFLEWIKDFYMIEPNM